MTAKKSILTPEHLAAARRIAAEAPPLSSSQRDALRRILGGAR